MTCIVGYVRDGRVWLGGDGAAGAAYYRKVRAGGVPREVALELALQWQGFMLTVGAQTHGQYG